MQCTNNIVNTLNTVFSHTAQDVCACMYMSAREY